jgi:hypothetical protein
MSRQTSTHFVEVIDSYLRWHNEMRVKIYCGSLCPIEYRLSLELAAYSQYKCQLNLQQVSFGMVAARRRSEGGQ